MLSFGGRRLYVQLSADWLSVRDPARDRAVAGPAALALRRRGERCTVVAYGQSAGEAARSAPDLELQRPFAHPRSLLSDFGLATALLQSFIAELRGGSGFALAPRVVIHPLGEFDGGLTQIECRGLRELALSAGAGDVILWRGRTLSDTELLSDGLRAEAERLGLPG